MIVVTGSRPPSSGGATAGPSPGLKHSMSVIEPVRVERQAGWTRMPVDIAALEPLSTA